MVADACVVDYVSGLKLETLPHSCNWNWRRSSVGHFTVSASTGKLNPVHGGSLHVSSHVEESSHCHWKFRAKVHIVQLLTNLPHPHTTGVHSLHRFMATIATAGLSSMSLIKSRVHSSRSTVALPGGFVCLPTSPKYPWSISCRLFIDYPNTILSVDLSSWLFHRLTC